VKIKLSLIALWFSFVCPSLAGAVTPAGLAAQAAQDYQSGHFEEAIKNWQTLAEIGFVNAGLYSNIGNAYWREGKVGSAKLYFLKAQELQPRNPGIRANLAFAEQKNPTGSPTSPDSILSKLPLYRAALNLDESLVLSATFITLIIAFLLVARFTARPKWKLLSLVILLPLLWSGGFLGYQSYQNLWAKPGIILDPQAKLLEAPVSTSATREVLREGEEVQLLKSEGNFVLVKTLSGRKGWLPKAQMGEV